MTLSRDFRKKAWESLKGKYWVAWVVSLLEAAIGGIAGSSGAAGNSDAYGVAVFGGIFSVAVVIFVTNVLCVGACSFYIKNTTQAPAIEEVFKAFKSGYTSKVMTMLVMDVKIFLWTLLFVIPGIVKAYEYSMIPYILAENDSITMEEAFAMSKKMMTGNKWRYFKLQFSFIGWAMLCLLTAGIGFFFLSPYIEAAQAEFYLEMKANYEHNDDVALA